MHGPLSCKLIGRLHAMGGPWDAWAGCRFSKAPPELIAQLLHVTPEVIPGVNPDALYILVLLVQCLLHMQPPDVAWGL